jgi:hypothetical protein
MAKAKQPQQKGVIDKIADSCDQMGDVDLAGITLESADPRLLDVSHMDLDRHVAMQPAAMAYYGSLLKDAARRLAAYKRSYDRWEKKKYAEAKASLASGTGKNTVADIEARFIVDNEAEIEKREKQMEKLQFEYDTLNVWFEAWRQKSFSIREHANITEDERWANSSSMTEKSGSRKDGMDRVRSIISKRREASTSA